MTRISQITSSIVSHLTGTTSNSEGPVNTPVAESLGSLLERLYNKDSNAATELSTLLLPGLRFIIRRNANFQDAEDVIQDTLLDILTALRDRKLHDADALPGFARTIALRKCAACVNNIVTNRSRFPNATVELFTVSSRHLNPEQSAMESQKVQMAATVLSQLSSRDREILHRFYIQEQSQEQICNEMELSLTQFRLLKSRAKSKFGDIGRRQYAPVV